MQFISDGEMDQPPEVGNRFLVDRKWSLESTVIDTRIPPAIVQQVLAPLEVVSTRCMPPGMSGAEVYQCRLGSGELVALKRWPEGSGATRIAEVHRVISHARASGCELVPQLLTPGNARAGQTIAVAGKEHWEVARWMPGMPLGAAASAEQVRRGAAAIAQFHAAVRNLGTCRQVPLAVTSRLSRLQQLHTELPAALAVDRGFLAPELAGPIQAACQLVQWKWDGVSSRIARSLSLYARRPVYTQYVLRDVHREHLLFSGPRVTGLIDFDAVRIDTPAADLARWSGSFLAGRDDLEPIWEAALAGFQEHCALKLHRDRDIAELAKDLCYATSWISLANWVVWVLLQRRSFHAGATGVASRITEITQLAIRQS